MEKKKLRVEFIKLCRDIFVFSMNLALDLCSKHQLSHHRYLQILYEQVVSNELQGLVSTMFLQQSNPLEPRVKGPQDILFRVYLYTQIKDYSCHSDICLLRTLFRHLIFMQKQMNIDILYTWGTNKKRDLYLEIFSLYYFEKNMSVLQNWWQHVCTGINFLDLPVNHVHHLFTKSTIPSSSPPSTKEPKHLLVC